MIILKDTTETLQATTSPGLIAPTRKGYSHSQGVGGSVTLTPDGTIAVGDWVIIVIATFNTVTLADPAGWRVLQPLTLAGTQNTAIYGKLREVGDVAYTVTMTSGGSAATDGTLFWGSGSDVVANWIVGSTMTRASITPTTSSGSVAPSITTTLDHTLVFAISTERTNVDESDIVSIVGAEKWLYMPQVGTTDIQTTTVGVIRDVFPAGATGDVRFTYPVPQAVNAEGVQIGIPPAQTSTFDYTVSYTDDDPSTGVAMSSSEGKFTVAATASILSAPASLVTRTVKFMNFMNTDSATTNTITIAKNISSTIYNLTPAIRVGPGEMVQFMDTVGWRLYAADGTIKANYALNTGTSQITINTSQVLGGSANLTWDKGHDTLNVGGTSPAINFGMIGSNPSAPSGGVVELFNSRFAGKQQLTRQASVGQIEAIQATIWGRQVITWLPGPTNIGTWTGTAGVNIGTTTTYLPLTSGANAYTAMRASTFATPAGANSQAGIRSDAQFFRSYVSGTGGFFFVARFGFTTIKTSSRAFIGFNPGSSIVNVEPSTLVNACGFGFDTTDTAWTFMHRDGTATIAGGFMSKDTIPGQGTLATNNTGYDAYIWAPPNSTRIYYRLDRTDTGATLIDSYADSNLPATNTMLIAAIHMGSGTNTAAGDATVGINQMYIETVR
jgi:hypothetical protein